MSKDKRFAIIVGTNNYEHKKLNYSIKDAADIKNILVDKCEFDVSNIVHLQYETYDDTDTSNDINQAFADIKAKGFQKNMHTFLLYFSGHGVFDENEAKSFVELSDSTKIPIQDILDKIKYLSGKNSYMIIDACQSGGSLDFTHTAKGKIERMLHQNSESLYCILGADKNQSAFEPTEKESKKSKIENGYLTHFIMEAINTKERYTNNKLSMKAIDDYVSLKAQTQTDFVQIPLSKSEMKGYHSFAVWKEDETEIINTSATMNPVNNVVEKTAISETSTEFVAKRIAEAFPGVRGLQWYEGEEAIQGLLRFFKKPINFDEANHKYDYYNRIHKDPIWWFRGSSSIPIEHFERLSDGKVLMDNRDELLIEKIAVFRSQFDYLNFIYIQTSEDTPTGFYNYTKEQIDNTMNSMGRIREEFALYNDVRIRIEEYQDDAAFIDGKYVPLNGGGEHRCLYTTKYNLIITAKGSRFNSNEGDLLGDKFMNAILRGTETLEDFVAAAEKLPVGYIK